MECATEAYAESHCHLLSQLLKLIGTSLVLSYSLSDSLILLLEETCEFVQKIKLQKQETMLLWRQLQYITKNFKKESKEHQNDSDCILI